MKKTLSIICLNIYEHSDYFLSSSLIYFYNVSCRYLAECHLSCFPPAFEAAEEAATEYYDCVSDTDDYTEIQRYADFEWNSRTRTVNHRSCLVAAPLRF